MTTNPKILADLAKAQAIQDAFYSKVNPLKAAAGIPTVNVSKLTSTFKDYHPDSATSNYLLTKLPTAGKKSATQDSTDKLQGSDLVRSQIATETAKLAGAGKAGSSGRHWWDDVAQQLLDKGGHAVDYGSRLGKGAEAVVYGLEHPDTLQGSELITALGTAAAGGITGKDEYTHSGKQILETNPLVSGMSGGWQKSLLTSGGGLALDIGTDPVTYLSGGATTMGKEAALSTLAKLEEAGGIARGVRPVAESIIAATEKGGTVAKGTKSLAASELKTKVAEAALKQSQRKYIMDPVLKQVKKESDDLFTRTGHYLPPADRAQRITDLSMKATEPFQSDLTKALLAANQRRVALRIVGKDVLAGKTGQKIGRALYKPFEIASKGANKLSPVRGLREAFQVGAHFPGQTNRVRRIAEARGIRAHEIVSKTIDKTLGGITKKTQEQILIDLERGIRTTGEEHGKDLGQIYDFFDNLRRENFDQLEAAGVYKPSDAVENYVPQFYRRGGTADIKEFKNGRKLAIRGQKGLASDYSIQAAKDQGLHPYTSVGDAFKLHDADVTRRIVRRNQQLGLVDNYGVLGPKEAADAMQKQGLVDASALLTPADRAKYALQGKTMFMHKEIMNTQDALDAMLKAGNHDDLNRLMRLADRVTNWWKRTATVYNPGNWFNNSLGDFTMNFIDGVQNPMDYIRAGRMVLGKDVGMKIPLGKGLSIDSGLFKQLYNDFGSGAGFLRADVGTDVASRLTHAVGKGFEGREDLGRMAHFAHALRDELSRTGDLRGLNTDLAKYLTKNPDPKELLKTAWGRRLTQAANAAGDRVSKWNIDYSAFTPFERKLKKVIPFYAWQRKSIPLLLEAMATKPGRVGAIRKTQDAISEMLGGNLQDQQGQYNVAYPDWLRQSSFMRLNDGKEPWVMQDPTPLAMWGKTFGADSPSALLRQQMSGLTPFLKDPIELATGKQLFSGKKLPADMSQYWESQLPFMSTINNLGGTDTRGNDMTPLQRILGLAGMKPYQMTDKTQAGELQRQKDPLDARLSKVNNALKTSKAGEIQLRKVKAGYKVYNKTYDITYGTVEDPGQAMALAVQAAGLNK